MKLLVKHLGRIAHADLELRPLTVLIGKNGTSKTWTAHSYFKLLEQLRIDAHRPASSPEGPMFRVANDVAEAWQARIGATTGAVEFSVQRDELIERLPEVVSFSLQGNVWPSTLGARLRQNTRVELQLSRDELRRGVATQLDVTVRRAPLAIEKSLILDGQPDPSTTTVYPSAEALGERLREAVEELLFGWRMHVRALPAERVNLAQLFPVLVRNKQVHMPRALVDFCYMMSLASAAPAQPTDPVLTEALARVAGGRFSFEERELMFHPLDASDVALPIRAAASLVKSVAGLDVFLSTAVRGDTLIIDEPEMNAHPEAQVALTELFAAMVRRGIHVVVATHSPYVLDHLTTLLEASRVDSGPRGKLTGHDTFGSSGLYLDPDELSVYQFETTGTVRSVFDRDRGTIDWSTFTAVSDRESAMLNALVAAEEADVDAP